MHTEQLLKSDLVAVEDAAKALGMDPKRFLGFCMRNKLPDPISDGKEVYGWSCATLAQRLSDTSGAGTTDEAGVVP
jgi:hypothetical protein